MNKTQIVEVIEGFLARWEEPSCVEQAEVVAKAKALLEQLNFVE